MSRTRVSDSPPADGPAEMPESPVPESPVPESSMAEPGVPDAQIRMTQDLLFFAYRDFTNVADVVLAELGLGRAHHRALHFVGRNPGITVTELLAILRITKQSLARVLGALVEDGYVAQSPGDTDRRQRLLRLTARGVALERRLFERQRACLGPALAAAGPAASAGLRAVLRGIMDDSARAYLDGAPSPGKDHADGR